MKIKYTAGKFPRAFFITPTLLINKKYETDRAFSIEFGWLLWGCGVLFTIKE